MRLLVPALSLFLACCASSPRLTLQQIQPVRVFQLTKAEVFETVRFFAIKEGFSLDSFEQETGRIIGHRTNPATASGETSKMIIIHLKVIPADSGYSEVTSKFAFSSLGDSLTREEEETLADLYSHLYDYLERKVH